MKYWKIAVLFSFTLFFFGCANKPQVQAPQAHQRPAGFWENEKTVVQVFHFYYFVPIDADGMPIFPANGQLPIYQQVTLGTGAVLDVNGLILTNSHVVTAEPVAGQLIVNSPLYPDIYTVCTVTDGLRTCVSGGEVVYKDPEHDLALVYIDQHFPRAIEFADDELKPGDEIYLWGNVGFLLPPSPFFGHFTGLIGPPYYTGEDIPKSMLPLMMVDINISFGTSGGPAFNEKGRYVGTAVGFRNATVLGSRSLPYIIPLSTVREFLSNWTHQR